MSTFRKRFSKGFLLCVVAVAVPPAAYPQILVATARIEPGHPSRITVEGTFDGSNGQSGRSLEFVDEYAGVKGLFSRVSSLKLFSTDGAELKWRAVPGGTVFANRPIGRFSYDIEAAVPEANHSAAHVSWVGGETGVLFLNDLMPLFGGKRPRTRFYFEIPEGWKIETPEQRKQTGAFEVRTPSDAVFVLGRELRERQFRERGKRVSLVLGGEWQFTDDEAVEMARSITSRYIRLFGKFADVQAKIFLMPFPSNAPNDIWSAETRGSAVMILSSPSTYRNLASQRLHEQMRHELLHLWIPGSLALTGDYAWFFEGFTLYVALKTGVRLGRIRFSDMLKTLAGAFDAASRNRRNLSLLELSRNRWRDDSANLYSKGMISAFFVDIRLLISTNGNKGIESLVRALLRKHRPGSGPEPANEALLRFFASYGSLSEIVDDLITGNESPDWGIYLSALGLENTGERGRSRLSITTEPDRRQRALLKRLGYNARMEGVRE